MRSAAIALALATTALAACGDTATAPDDATVTATATAVVDLDAAGPAATGETPLPDATATPTPTATATASPEPIESAKAAATTAAAEPKKAAGLSPAAARAAANDRHEKYEQLGRVNKAVTDELRKPDPDLAAVRQNAVAIRDLSAQMINWFPAGSGPQDGIKTDSKANVWTDWAGFRQAHQRMVAQSRAFVTTVEGGDAAAIKSASRTLGAACKNCHDDYRVEDD